MNEFHTENDHVCDAPSFQLLPFQVWVVSAVNTVELVSPEEEADGLEDPAPEALHHGGADEAREGREGEEELPSY